MQINRKGGRRKGVSEGQSRWPTAGVKTQPYSHNVSFFAQSSHCATVNTWLYPASTDNLLNTQLQRR